MSSKQFLTTVANFLLAFEISFESLSNLLHVQRFNFCSLGALAHISRLVPPIWNYALSISTAPSDESNVAAVEATNMIVLSGLETNIFVCHPFRWLNSRAGIALLLTGPHFTQFCLSTVGHNCSNDIDWWRYLISLQFVVWLILATKYLLRDGFFRKLGGATLTCFRASGFGTIVSLSSDLFFRITRSSSRTLRSEWSVVVLYVAQRRLLST